MGCPAAVCPFDMVCHLQMARAGARALSFRYADCVKTLSAVTGRRTSEVSSFRTGGGSRGNSPLRRQSIGPMHAGQGGHFG